MRGEREITQRCKFLCLNQSYHKEQVREARMMMRQQSMQNVKDKLGSAQTPTSTPATIISATPATASGDSEIYAAYSVLFVATAAHRPVFPSLCAREATSVYACLRMFILMTRGLVVTCS